MDDKIELFSLQSLVENVRETKRSGCDFSKNHVVLEYEWLCDDYEITAKGWWCIANVPSIFGVLGIYVMAVGWISKEEVCSKLFTRLVAVFIFNENQATQ